MQPKPKPRGRFKPARLRHRKHARHPQRQHEKETGQPENEAKHATDPSAPKSAQRGRSFQLAPQLEPCIVETCHSKSILTLFGKLSQCKGAQPDTTSEMPMASPALKLEQHRDRITRLL